MKVTSEPLKRLRYRAASRFLCARCRYLCEVFDDLDAAMRLSPTAETWHSSGRVLGNTEVFNGTNECCVRFNEDFLLLNTKIMSGEIPTWNEHELVPACVPGRKYAYRDTVCADEFDRPLPAYIAGKVSLRIHRLDNGGYDKGGRYFGVGALLWDAFDDGGALDVTFRCSDREAAKARIRAVYPTVKFYR